MRIRHVDGMSDAHCVAEAKRRHRWGALAQAIESVAWWISGLATT